MEPPQPSAWDWLAIDRAPQPPDLSQSGSPEVLTAYLVGVEERMQRLALIVEAVRQSLAVGGLLSEAQLLEKVAELDLRDGVADGRNVSVTASNVPHPAAKSLPAATPAAGSSSPRADERIALLR